MPTIARPKSREIESIVTPDGMRAWLRIAPTARGADACTEQELHERLQRIGISLTTDVRERVRAIAAELARGETQETSWLVAEGTPPTSARDGSVEFHPDLRPALPPEAETSVDHFAQCQIVTVVAGATIGVLRASEPAVDGLDVFGRSVGPHKRLATPLQIGDGVRRDEADPTRLIAERAGCVRCDGGILRIDSVLEIPGNVDLESGSIETNVDVRVAGTIRANFHVYTDGSLNVGRAVEPAADVRVGRNLAVTGGIFGHDRSTIVRCGGALAALLCDEADVQVGGDVRLVREAMNSHIECDGRLTISAGAIVGGRTSARQGLEARVLGSEAGVMTYVRVGVPIEILRQCRELELNAAESARSAAHLHVTIRQLTPNMRRLSSEQRERATELMARAEELDADTIRLAEERKHVLATGTPPEPAGIRVLGAIHPGVIIGIGSREARIRRLLRGPLRIEQRAGEMDMELVVVYASSGITQTLPSTDIDLRHAPLDAPNGACHEP